MKTGDRIRKRPKSGQPLFCVSALAFGWPQVATLLQCGPRDSALVCHMRSLLTVLHTVAAILAALLAVAVLFAVYAYRSKPDNLAPQKDRPDA